MTYLNKIKKYAVFFLIGGLGYAIIEILWRGHTHWSMMLAGGICFVLFSVIAKKFSNYSLLLKALICSLCVTAIELIFGIIFNIILKMNVWDYSQERFNFRGQICPVFSVLWGILGAIFIPVADKLNKYFTRN